MPEILPTSFTAWKFTEEEERRARVLTELTTKYIQTELAINAEKSLQLEPNPDARDPTKEYLQQVMYHKGFGDALAMMLTNSEETKEELRQQIEAQRNSQNQN